MGEISLKDAASMDTGVNVASAPITANMAQSMGQSNPIQYIPPQEPQLNILERLERGFTRSVDSAPQIVGQGLYYLGSNFHPDATPEDQENGSSFGDRLAHLGLTMTERNKAEIAQKYPEQPDIWENIGGALPAVGAFALGSMTGFTEAAAATLAVGGGTQAGLQAFSALKARGVDTERANLYASVVGAGAGSAMAFGIGNFLKATGPALVQLAKGVVNGYLAGAAQTGVTGSLELATGVREYDGINSLKDLLVEAHTSGTTFAVLGGGLGIHQAFVQQRAIAKGYQAAGLSPKESMVAAKRGMSILNDKGIGVLEQDIKQTPDEKRRMKTIQLNKNKSLDETGSPRTDILDEPFVPKEPNRTEALTAQLEAKKRSLELIKKDLADLKSVFKSNAEDLNDLDQKNDTLARENYDKLQGEQDRLKQQIEDLREKLAPKSVNPLTDLNVQIAKLNRGFRAGESATLKDVDYVQKEFNRLVDQSNLDLADKAKFRKSMPLTVDEFHKELPNILNKIQTLEERAEQKNWTDDLAKVKLKTIDKLPIDYQDALKPLLSSFDLKNRSKTVIEARGKTIAFMKEKLSQGEPLSEGEQKALDLAASKSVSEMSHEELRQVHDTVMQVVHEGLMTNKYLANKMARSHEERVQKFLKNIDSEEFKTRLDNFDKNSSERNRGPLQKLLDVSRKLNDGLTSPEFMSKWMGTEDFFQSLHEGFQNKIEFRQQYEKAIEKIYGKLDYAKVIGEPIDSDELKGLGFIEAPHLDDLMRVYAQSFDEGGYRHLENTMTKSKLEGFLKWFETNHPDLVNIIHKQFDFFRDVVGPQVDATTVEVKGHHIKQVDFYDPINGSLEDRSGEDIKHQMELGSKSMYDRAIPFSGFTKARVESKLAFRKFDYFRNTLNHLSDVANYRAMAKTLSDANKFFYDPRVTTALRDKFGPEWVSMVHSWLRDSAFDGHQYDTYAARLAANIRMNFVFAKLLFNIPSGGKVFAQWGPANSYVGAKWMLPATRDYVANTKHWDDFIDKNSLQMKNRYFMQERETADAISRQGITLTKLGKIQRTAVELGMAVHQWADKINTRITFLGEYRKQLALNEFIGGTQEDAIEAAEKAVRLTHPMGGTLYLPSAFRGPEWQKAITTFLNAPNKSFNLLRDNTKSLSEGKMGVFEYARKLLSIGLIPAVVLSAWASRRVPTVKEVAAEELNQTICSELYLGFITRALVTHTDVGATTPWLAPFTDLMHAFQRKDKLRYGLATLDDIIGTGTANIYRLINGSVFKSEPYASGDTPSSRPNERDTDNPFGSGRI